MTVVREPRPADREAIASLHVAAIEAFGPEAYDDDEVAAWAASDDSPAERYAIEEGYWVVAERERGLAGFGELDPRAGEVVAVYVHPDHARSGVGSALLASLEGYARGVGLAELALTASRNAVGFYERAGYERDGPVVHETSTGVELDCVRMTKRL
jgi:putative acetyltransferase